MATLDRITTHPLVLNGRPCIRGLRVTVANILRLMAAGNSNERILETFPYLDVADLDACVAYAGAAGEKRARRSRGSRGLTPGGRQLTTKNFQPLERNVPLASRSDVCERGNPRGVVSRRGGATSLFVRARFIELYQNGLTAGGSGRRPMPAPRACSRGSGDPNVAPRFQRGVVSPRALRVASATLETFGQPSFRKLRAAPSSVADATRPSTKRPPRAEARGYGRVAANAADRASATDAC